VSVLIIMFFCFVFFFRLIRFSQFFVSPLVKIEAMEREVLAVDSGVSHSYLSKSISFFPFLKEIDFCLLTTVLLTYISYC